VPRNKLPPLDDVGAQFVFELAPFQSKRPRVLELLEKSMSIDLESLLRYQIVI